jgi:hypothetical protein
MEFAWQDIKGNLVQGSSAAEVFADVLDRDDRLGHD